MCMPAVFNDWRMHTWIAVEEAENSVYGSKTGIFPFRLMATLEPLIVARQSIRFMYCAKH